MIRAILACDEHWGIGKDNTLPWPHNPADLKWFKESTNNSVVVMGRHTWESLPKRPLPNRVNYVIASNPDISPGYHGRFSVSDPNKLGKAITAIIQDRHITQSDIWIIGGSQLVNSCLSIIDEIWLSRISGTYSCDTFLPRTAIELTFRLDSTEDINGLCIEKWKK